MTTQIDKIMKSIISLDTSSDQDDKIRQILEAELTAVKGVDELVEKRENTSQTLAYIAGRSVEDAGKYKQIMDCISDLKALKQTPVAEEYPCTECGGNAYEGYIVEEGNCKIAKGERLCNKCMEKRNPDFIEQEEQLKDSQTKEVCLHCKSEFNYKLPNGLCSSCNMKLIDR